MLSINRFLMLKGRGQTDSARSQTPDGAAWIVHGGLASYDAASNPRKFVRNTESGFESNFRLGDDRALAFLSLPNGRHHGRLWPSALAAAGLLLVVPWSSPALLQPLNRFWTKLGLHLHRIANPIVMGLLFYGTILPTGLVMRPRGGDFLRLKREPDAESYWICAHAGERRKP